jgi:hypothetical protein
MPPILNFGMGGMVQRAVARESGQAPDRPRMVPRDLPPPQIQNEPTLKEMMDRSLYFQLLEEHFKKNPPKPLTPGPHGNQYLPSKDDRFPRVDENAPIRNPWHN